MSDLYRGYKEYHVNGQLIEDLYTDETIECWDRRCSFYPNMYVILRDEQNDKHTALGKVDRTGQRIMRIQASEAEGVQPRNVEQVFALDALLDDGIKTLALTGPAGTGKTILTLAAAFQKIKEKKYAKVILTKPMSQVGKYQLGALPGDVRDKFHPYLANYMTNLELFSGGRGNLDYLLDAYKFEMVPLQFFRGASFNNCLVIADEIQIMDHHEMLTIGSRIGEGSKLVCMGDLNQRDEKIAKDKTGLHKVMNDRKMKESPLVAGIELQKCERSEIARLFAEVFEE